MVEQIAVLVPKPVAKELRAELAHRQKDPKYRRLTQSEYAAAILEAGVERERQEREARERATAVIAVPTAAQTAQVLSKMAPAVAR